MSNELKGLSLIGSESGSPSSAMFCAVNPVTGGELQPEFYSATEAEVDRACTLADEAFKAYRRVPGTERAALLRHIAQEIEQSGDAITQRYVQESGLPEGRANGERARTVGQLQMFARLLEDGKWSRVAIDHADPDRQPLPKPDTRMRYIGIGPVAVFGPANFPLAFTVAGGDTASALAAGCPVVAKAHSSHPGTSELVGQAIRRAVQSCGMHAGVFSLLFGSGMEIGPRLVQHPAIKAVGFTGSETVGRRLFDLACARPLPIPVFAEMSSINPVILLPEALAASPQDIADGLYGSVTLGVGQFCTNPGIVLLPPGDAADALAAHLKEKLQAHPCQTMLNKSTRESYAEGLRRLSQSSGVETLLSASDEDGTGGCDAGAALFRTSCGTFLQNENLHDEVFGPATLLVTCSDEKEMQSVLTAVGGQLTATVHATDADIETHRDLLADLETRVGRIIINGFPTGVEVCSSMVHGGPNPASTDTRFTSVGTEAIYRFLRPVCYQGFPRQALPEELR